MNAALQNARDKARETLAKYPGAVSDGRIDVNYIAEMAGIDVTSEYMQDQSISGFLQKKTADGRPIIVLNNTNSDVRQRFTIAHELGHYFLHSSQSTHVDDMYTAELVMYRNQESSQATHLREIEANQFAAELLMPERMVLDNLQQLRSDSKGMSEIVGELAAQYQVSETAMTIRLEKIA